MQKELRTLSFYQEKFFVQQSNYIRRINRTCYIVNVQSRLVEPAIIQVRIQ